MGRASWKKYTREVYAPQWGAGFHNYIDWYLAGIIDQLKLSEPQRVLDVGIGAGEPMAISMAESGAEVIGVDLSPMLLSMARDNAERRGLHLAPMEADAEFLPFKGEQFDLLYCVSTSWQFPNFTKAITEMSRVPRPGGRVVFDVINGLHPTNMITHLAAHGSLLLRRSITASLRRKPSGAIINHTVRFPWAIASAAKQAGLEPEVSGFYVLLPVSLPRVGNRVNLADRVKLTATGLRHTPILKYLGSKLVYVCNKP